MTSKTPEGRSATFRVQGFRVVLLHDFLKLFFLQKKLSHLFVFLILLIVSFLCFSFFWILLICFSFFLIFLIFLIFVILKNFLFFASGQVKGHAQQVATPTNQPTEVWEFAM